MGNQRFFDRRLELVVSLTAPQCLCGGNQVTLLFDYKAPPAGEIKFNFNSGDHYRRQVFKCVTCGHMQSVHNMKTDKLYSGEYVNATYGDVAGLKRNFDRITQLDPSKSDNIGRVTRVNEFAKKHFGNKSFQNLNLLDVGSGLGVFVHRMKATGWNCTALDPDKRTTDFAVESIGVKAICTDFYGAKISTKYDLISFNKVIEHALDPIGMLAKSLDFLDKDGLVYVEVPDGEMASKEGSEREEFFVEHPHIFSMTSMAILAVKAGFVVDTIERIREPSTKYTLRAFLKVE
jgi:hypothetical protein